MLYRNATTEIHYEDFGKGPAVVVLHDQPSNLELRQSHFEGLARAGCRVIIINPGGLAKGEGALPAPAGTEMLLSLLNTLGIGRAVMIGIGRGGYTTLDMLENFPRRVAAASFVVSPELAADLQRRTCSREALKALRRGRLEVLKQVFLRRRNRAPAPPRLPRLQAWIQRLQEMNTASCRGPAKESAALLASFQLPPLIIEEESNSGSPAATPKRATPRPFHPLRSLSTPLQALLQVLLPSETLFDEKDDPVTLDHG